MSAKTDFFIVGAPKAGTTALHNTLALHPEIFMPDIKEPNFFSGSELKANKLYYREKIITDPDEYQQLYAKAGNKLKGDASVSYLFYPSTAGNIFQYNPQAKIIIILRHPVERAVSHYRMDQRLGWVKAGLEDIFFKNRHPASVFFQQYFLLGKYAEQVKRYLEVFPEDQVKIFLFEELKSDFRKTVSETLTFLGVKATDEIQISENQNASFVFRNRILSFLYRLQWLRKGIKKIMPESLSGVMLENLTRKPSAEISEKLLKELSAFYREDIMALSNLIKKDLTHWLK
jgi:hypothetical protein